MQPERAHKEPGFFWQGTFIVLPVILLVGMGLLSLRQDKMLATQEARERAQTLAGDLSRRIWDQLTAGENPPRNDPALGPDSPTNDVCRLTVDARGRLLFPPPYASTPVPAPYGLSQLTEDQSRRWETARAAEYQSRDPAAAVRAWRAFIATAPPSPFRAAAHLALGIVSIKAGRWPDAEESFARARAISPGVLGESGLPFPPLIDIQRLQWVLDHPGTTPNASLEINTICAEAINQPTVLTPKILALAAEWRRRAGDPVSATNTEALWARHESARRLWRSIETSGAGETNVFHVFWISVDKPWLVVPLPDPLSRGSDLCLVCRSETATQRWLGGLMRDAEPIPQYFGVTVELGRRLVWSAIDPLSATGPSSPAVHRLGPSPSSPPFAGGSNTSNAAPAILASDTRAVGGDVALRVNVHLVQPQLLYARQQSRTRWFGLLILTAALTALAGLAAAWKAFHRQRRLSQLKSDFVSSVSHELRAPIASVRLMAERLEGGRVKTDAKKSEYFRFIRQECQRLSSLMENVLDFSRLEQGRKQYEMEPVDPLELVRQTVQVMEPAAAERQIQLVTQLSGALPEALNVSPSWDGRAVQQALVNLIDNALKHSPPGECVNVGFELSGEPPHRDRKSPVSPSPRWVHLWVEDHGPGIPPAEHARIFERFYRLGSELRRETPGVGIGLSIVKHVVQAHGGRVIVRSAVGQGSRFTLALPIVPPGEDK